MFAEKELVEDKYGKIVNAIKVIKKSKLLSKESFQEYILKKKKLYYLKRKYQEWENKSDGIVWPIKKKVAIRSKFGNTSGRVNGIFNV